MSHKIQWLNRPGTTGETWNPVTGCRKLSEGCANCYASRMAHRLAGRYGYPADDPFRVTVHPEKLDQPLTWKKPRTVFTVSMGDLFHGSVPTETIFDIFSVMERCPQHTFILLTKRPESAEKVLSGLIADPLPNVWLGTTVENQQAADERIPWLLKCPAAVRFLSVEPMLGPALLGLATPCDRQCSEYIYAECPGTSGMCICERQLDWVIAGGESGPGARPMQVEWVRDLRDQCVAADVPFFFKSWGKNVPAGQEQDKLDGEMWHQWPEV